MKRFLAPIACAIALLAGACSPTQVNQATTDATTAVSTVQQTAAKIDPALTAACTGAMQLVPLASLAGPAGASVAGYATAGCSDAEKITALAADPSSAAWVGGLIQQMKGLIPTTSPS